MTKSEFLNVLQSFSNKFADKIEGLFVRQVEGKDLSTNDYTTTEKNKLSNIEENANNYSHPTYTSVSAGLYKVTVDSKGHVSKVSQVTKADIINLGITEYSAMSGATSSSKGTIGLVPAPAAGENTCFLRGDGTWAEVNAEAEEITDDEIDAIIAGTFEE